MTGHLHSIPAEAYDHPDAAPARTGTRFPRLGAGAWPMAALAAGAFAVGALALADRRARRRAMRCVRELQGRTVLVSGGARGLGFLLAREYIRWGAQVWITSRSADELGRAAAELGDLGGDVRARVADVREPDDARALIAEIITTSGRIDVLVNNAGVIQATPIEHAQLEDFVDSLETHLWGPMHLIREALPYMRRDGGGRLVNIASIGGRIAVPHLVPYSVGKFALVGLSEGLRSELQKDGISVTTVCPGLMRTGSHVRARLRGRHEAEARWFGLAVSTPLSSMSARRAAEAIVWASVRRRSRLTVGWQARAAEVLDTLAPEAVARVTALVNAYLLPPPAREIEADRSRVAGDVGFGWVTPFLPTRAARQHNELPAEGRTPGGGTATRPGTGSGDGPRL